MYNLLKLLARHLVMQGYNSLVNWEDVLLYCKLAYFSDDSFEYS